MRREYNDSRRTPLTLLVKQVAEVAQALRGPAPEAGQILLAIDESQTPELSDRIREIDPQQAGA